MEPPYKSKINTWFTKSLFWDMWVRTPESGRACEPVFTFHQDKPGLINGRKTFVELNDPTGYKWAIKYLGDWEHFLYLQKSTWFLPVLQHWREELQVKMTSEAVDKIRAIAEEGGQQSLVANKYLADRTWERAGAQTTRGRPSKAELKGELKRAAEVVQQEDDDMERIGLRVVK